ncbi:HD domain-containing phosphohydrolase [Deinococcus budaensis]|uniref:Diguanylate cyclase n=1 Tax=Deinococcus budaensis TaxID=1665626 RepID=A0A7W8LPL2_9DEIO|nr:HD domain-containing phosphohydrolase [Deinococcus budaensis]MBB5233752.1 diguanylate cyclase [Deinococcus budaensis]
MLFNLSLLVSCAFLLSLSYHEWPVRRRRAEHVLRVALASGASWLLMMYALRLEGFRLDLRYVPVALVTLRYGPLAGALTLLPALLWRAAEDLHGGLATALSGLSVVALTGALRRRLPVTRPQLRARDLWLAPVPFLGVGLPLLLTPQGRSVAALYYPLGVLLSAAGAVLALGILHSRLRLLSLAHTLRTQARTDDLTGLSNRRQFDEDLAALDPGTQLVLLDLDHFKRINDTHGHAAGDRALEHVAALLRELDPAHLRPYRVGGEEFALLADLGAESRARAQVEALLREVPAAGRGMWAGLTLSAGLATRRPGESAAALFRRADEALYLAKTNGRGRLVVWTPPDGSAARAAELGAGAPGTELAGQGWPGPGLPGSGPIQPRHSVWQALRTTVGLLAERRTLHDEDWTEVLRLAVDAVDGAVGGSLAIREGRGFRICAAEGYGPELMGLTLSEASQQRWYARSPSAWRAGRPRVLRGAELQAASVSSGEVLEDGVVRALEAAGRGGEHEANLCLPVVLGGEVVAHLNLDARGPADAFDDQSTEVAELFARQIAALLDLQERWRELGVLGELHLRVGAGRGGAVSVDEHLSQAAVDLLRARWAVLLRYDPAGDRLLSSGAEIAGGDLGPVELPRGEGLAWAALREGRTLRVDDVQQHPGVYRRAQLGHQAMLVAPLPTHHLEPLGVLVITREAERPFLPADEHLALMLASLAARLLERGAHVQDLRATLEAALNTLGFALEARDFETQGHTERVQAHALAFGQALGLCAERLLGLRQGAALHDIGKLGVPDAVLLKPGRLTPQEREVVEGHVLLGAALTARIPFLHPEAIGVVRSHHERWDGQGYPDGLKGEEIPPLARLFALCDVYDALVSARPYRPALPPAEALALLRAGRGTQFDPHLTDRFVELWQAGAFGSVRHAGTGAPGRRTDEAEAAPR